MPFKIVRNDITKVKADVIVNTANPNPICASGTDLAIYEAAGKELLLEERRAIGKICRGDIALKNYIVDLVGVTVSCRPRCLNMLSKVSRLGTVLQDSIRATDDCAIPHIEASSL